MPFFSLRGTISALSACCVAVVAIITLSITLTTSLQALRDIGKTHAASLLANARLQTEDLFEKPARATEAIRNITMSSAWAWPSDDATVLAMYKTIVRDQFLTCGTACLVSLFFYDNTRYVQQDIPWNSSQPEYGGSLFLPAPYSIGGIAYQRTQPITTQRDLNYWATHQAVPPTDPSYYWDPPVGNLVRDTPFWNGTAIPATFGGLKTTMPGVYLVVFGGTASNYIPIVAPLYRAGTTTKGANTVYAFSAITLDTSGISKFLKSVGGTANTASFAYDASGFLVGSSQTAPFEILTTAATASALRSGPGCATTAATDGAAATLTTIYYSSCRTHIASYGFAPLAQLASDNDFIFHPSNAVQLLTVGSDVYYAAVTKVSLPYPGISIWLALVMPEADVIGDVVTGRNTAIGITCGVFVVVACLSFGLISLLLRPLTTIADRMMLAASLEDDGNGEKELSSMAEVEDLQQAYYAMNDELIRIKSFVPQTVLRTKRVADPDESATEDEDLASKSLEHETTQSNASRRPPASMKSASYSRKSSNRAAVAGLNVACGLASQSVSVVVANLNRFEATANDTSRDAVVAAVGDTVKMVHDVVAAQKGVVQSFHGDHFVVSFNAVTACAAHARRAAVTALQLSREARGVGLRLGLRAGVGTGRCLVGNLGSAEAKGFSTIGSAFAHANVMERLTRVYGEGCQVLAAKRTCVDIATHVRYRYVDVVQLPRLKGATLIGALLGEANGHDDAAKNGGGAGVAAESEWLYIVENTTGSDGVINAAFTALLEGKVDEANALLGKGLKDVADVQSGNIHSRVLAVRDEMVSEGLTTVPVRDLGLLYRAGFRIDEH